MHVPVGQDARDTTTGIYAIDPIDVAFILYCAIYSPIQQY